MSLTVLVSLLRILISFCHLLVEDSKFIYLFGRSSFHFLAKEMRSATLYITLYQDHKNSNFHQYLLYLIISFVDICVPRPLLTSSTHFFNILVIFYVRFKFDTGDLLFVYFNSSFDKSTIFLLLNNY